jgi:Uma2 family endonuclease
MKLEIPDLPMTVDDFERLPRVDGVRYELVEGALVLMNAFYAAWHGEMIVRLVNLFRAHGRTAYPERGVRINRRTRRSADIGVFHKPLSDLTLATHDPADFSHVVEVVSPDDRDRDFHEKAISYATAGIPEYWIVDDGGSDMLDGVVFIYRLELTEDGPRYQLRRQTTVKALEADGI